MAEDHVVRYPWYEVVSGPDLQQGDMLLDCPVFLIPREAVRRAGAHPITIQRQNVIVMTQSCDLAILDGGRSKADDVILAAVYSRHELEDDRVFGKTDNWESARRGRFPRYHVLNKCGLPGHVFDFMLVDLARVFTLSINAVREVAVGRGNGRVRLLPPYREHLSQAFARFFMRVGLPVDIPQFK
jgi:hypothetical protein